MGVVLSHEPSRDPRHRICARSHLRALLCCAHVRPQEPLDVGFGLVDCALSDLVGLGESAGRHEVELRDKWHGKQGTGHGAPTPTPTPTQDMDGATRCRCESRCCDETRRSRRARRRPRDGGAETKEPEETKDTLGTRQITHAWLRNGGLLLRAGRLCGMISQRRGG
jgi:hypothetical protein